MGYTVTNEPKSKVDMVREVAEGRDCRRQHVGVCDGEYPVAVASWWLRQRVLVRVCSTFFFLLDAGFNNGKMNVAKKKDETEKERFNLGYLQRFNLGFGFNQRFVFVSGSTSLRAFNSNGSRLFAVEPRSSTVFKTLLLGLVTG